MTFWDSAKAFFRREAADIKEGLDGLRDKLDAELTRREEELAATPAERVDQIGKDIESGGDVFDRIEDKIDERLRSGTAQEEPAEDSGDAPEDGRS